MNKKIRTSRQLVKIIYYDHITLINGLRTLYIEGLLL